MTHDEIADLRVLVAKIQTDVAWLKKFLTWGVAALTSTISIVVNLLFHAFK